jgi:hypothetical protein
MFAHPPDVHVPEKVIGPIIELVPAPLADMVSNSTFAVCPELSPVKAKKGAEALSIKVVFGDPAPTEPAPVFGVPVPVISMPTPVIVIPLVQVQEPAGI